MKEEFNTYRVEVPADLVRRMKHLLAELGITNKQFMEEAIEEYTRMHETYTTKNGKH